MHNSHSTMFGMHISSRPAYWQLNHAKVAGVLRERGIKQTADYREESLTTCEIRGISACLDADAEVAGRNREDSEFTVTRPRARVPTLEGATHGQSSEQNSEVPPHRRGRAAPRCGKKLLKPCGLPWRGILRCSRPPLMSTGSHIRPRDEGNSPGPRVPGPYPLTAPAARPDTTNRCARKYRTTTGSEARIAPAMIAPQMY